MSNTILFTNLHNYLMNDPLYGYKKEKNASKNKKTSNIAAPFVTDWIDKFYKDNTEEPFKEFRDAFNRITQYRNLVGVYRHLIYLWCLNGLNAYREDGSLLSDLSEPEYPSRFPENTRFKKDEFKEFLIEKKLPLPQTLFQIEKDESKSIIKTEKECQQWIEELMANNSIQEKAKICYKDEASQKYNIGTKAFNRAWANAKSSTNNINWGKPGRRK